jgi:ergothioneine biosynthesis protein EgtB
MPQPGSSIAATDRAGALERFARNRRRTRGLFDLLDESVYYDRPIALRNPVVFYEGHIPAFTVNTLVKRALGRPGIDAHLETIFARGIDPESEATAVARGNPAWPSRAEVRAYVEAADALVEDAIRSADLDRPGHELLDGAQALWAVLEHEEMHQETLAYIWHQVPCGLKRRPAGYTTLVPGNGPSTASARARVPEGIATLGSETRDTPFAWDNELPAHQVAVPAFSIDRHNITNRQFLEFVDAGGYRDPAWWRPEDWRWVRAGGVSHPPFWDREDGRWFYRGMFERVPLPEAWPVYVTWAEAGAFARWRGLRLPTEPEYQRAAYATPEGGERMFPWTSETTGALPANVDFARWDPEPVGARPDGASAFGVHDLVGNGWEWTGTPFGPFDGFRPLASYPEYSADFFDGDHFVMKGASPVTPRTLIRRGFRNWFRPHYPYVYATFRCVGD